MMMWFHCLHIPLYTELNFHVRKSQSVAGAFLFGCSFKKRMKNLEGKINSWKMKFILTRKLKAYSHAKQLENWDFQNHPGWEMIKFNWMKQLLSKSKEVQKEKTHLSSPFPKQIGDKNLEQWFNPSIPGVRARCTCRAHTFPSQCTRNLEAFKEHREVAWKLAPQREEGTEEEFSISWLFV